MKAFVDSLSLGSGALVVAIVSAGIVWLLCFLFPASPHKLWALIVPFALAYCLYWSPVWLDADQSEFHHALLRSEYHTWQFVIVPWFLAGAIPSAAIVFMLGQPRRVR
jgi:hypothetical protein